MTAREQTIAAGAPDDPRLARGRRTGVIVAAVALVVAAFGVLLAPRAAASSWLIAFMFWLGLSLGCLGLMMLHLLTGGRWGIAIRRELEAGARQLPWLALAFVPVALSIPYLYSWAVPEAALDEVLRHKRAYLNVPAFLIRAALYFVIWTALAFALTRWSRAQDGAFDPDRARRMRRVAAGGLILYAITMTLAGTDWVMSLDPHWYSTIFGFLLIGGQGLLALAFVIVVSGWLRHLPAFGGLLTPDRFHDLGKLLLAFVILWAYFSFSQYLIIWSENLPEEILWYVHRASPAWQAVALTLGVFHFAVPFFVLLSRRVKRAIRPLIRVAAFVMAMRVLDLFWLIVPSVPDAGPHVVWLSVVMPLALGGLWMAGFFDQLRRRPLLPVGDPQLDAMLAAGPRASHQ